MTLSIPPRSPAVVGAFAVWALLTGLVVACGPSQEELDAERSRVRSLQEQLRDAQAAGEELDTRVTALLAQNEEMANRLRALGQNVEQLEGTRASLESSLSETQRALERLRAEQRQARERLAAFEQMVERFRAMIDAGRLRVRIRNNRMIVELPEGVLFDSARAQIKDEGEATLTEVAQILQTIEDRNFQIAGHTDNVPIRSRRFPSNWELSAARAVNVARFLVEQGVSPARLSAAGYADTEPVAEGDTAEARAQNRRIEIVLVPNLNELPNLDELRDSLEG